MSIDSSRGSLEPLDQPADAVSAENKDHSTDSSTSDTITQSAPAVLGQSNEPRSSEGSVSEVTDSGAHAENNDEATPEEEEDDDDEDDFDIEKTAKKVRWKRSRYVKIEKRAEGFGFTLRNVVIYPSDIHKIAASMGKRPKDIEPSWVEGKPLDAVLVREVRESGAAQIAGLRPGDRIVAHEGQAIESYSKFVAKIHQCSAVLEVTVISGADDPLSCGLSVAGPGPGLSRSVNVSGSLTTTVQRSHWLSSSLAPRPYLSTYHRGGSSQPRSLPNHGSPINQSTVSLTESTTGGSVSGAESEMSLSMPSIPIPPSCSVPSRLDSTLKPQRKKRRDKTKTPKHNKKESKRSQQKDTAESRSSSLSSLGPSSPAAASTSVAAKLQLFEGGQGFLARSMEKLKLYRSELTRMASPPPNTVQVRTAQFEKTTTTTTSGDKKGTTSPPPGATLKKLKTLFSEKTVGGGGCALKVLKCPDGGKKLDHNWRPADVSTQTIDGRLVLKIVTDKDSINVILNKLLADLQKSNLTVDFATLEYAKRRKNVLRLRTNSPASVMKDCALCTDLRDLSEGSEYEFLIQCDTTITMHNICSVINSGCIDPVKIAPSVIERAAAFDRRFFKNHRHQTSAYKSSVASIQRSKSRRASVGDEPNLVAPRHTKDKGHSIGVPLELCPFQSDNVMVPWLVVHCCNIIECKGLDVVGIYRIPGNSAAVQHLTQVVNLANGKNINLSDPKWSDVNVVTSLLKSFFRLLPEPLLSSALYHHFIAIDKIPDCRSRLGGIQALIQKLPPAHFETLRYFCTHLQRVASHSENNKMDSRNLSIVLGPTLVRSMGTGAQCSMLSMISDMQHQCHITETMINYADYLFQRASRCSESSSVLSTLIDLDPLPSSSSSESLNTRKQPFSRTLNSKLSLVPGTPTPTLSVKQKIMSFESGKPPVLEETALSSSYPPSPSKSTAFLDDTFSSLTNEDPMSMSYHERRVLAQEKAKVFEEETRAVLEKKAFRNREQNMSREQTERRWQEVKRQATLLTRDNSDDNIDKENQSSQNVESCAPGVAPIANNGIDERDSRNVTSPCGAKKEEVVMMRTRSGRNIHRGNRYGVVYSPNSSKILKSIVQSDDRSREGSQRKKSRLERRHTIAGSHSHSQDTKGGVDKGLKRTPSERKPKMHRSTT